MSPLARLLARRGAAVIGSDRSSDDGLSGRIFDQLRKDGIRIVPQDGAAVTPDIDTFVVTRAVEESIPDIRRARELNLRILKRPLLMAELFSGTDNIAVGGTSGKSTTTGMIAHILITAGQDPTVMNGATMINSGSNFIDGKSSIAVFEADESDGDQDVIAVCPADIAVLTNISLDHFSLDELSGMFGRFVQKARTGAVLNRDCASSMSLKPLHSNIRTFGLSADADFSPDRFPVTLPIPGEHNLLNALAAMAACSLKGIPPQESVQALASFRGIKRRLELIGTARGIRVIDDFASNPGKIEASVRTVQQSKGRTIIIFQPHGFQPTKMMKQGYIDTFRTLLRPDDLLVMPDIYYAGGNVNLINGEVVSLPKDISSKDITDAVAQQGAQTRYIPQRGDIIPALQQFCRADDTIIIMGSRDNTLSDFAEELLKALA